MSQKIPFCFWQNFSDPILILEHDYLARIQLSAIYSQPKKFNVLWGDGSRDKSPNAQTSVSSLSHTYDTSSSGTAKIKFVPAQLLQSLTIYTYWDEGVNTLDKATFYPLKLRKIQNVQFVNTPLNDIDFTNTETLESVTIQYTLSGIHKIQNISINNINSLRSVTLVNTDVISLDLSNNVSLEDLNCYDNPISALTMPTVLNSLDNFWMDHDTSSSIDMTRMPGVINFSLKNLCPTDLDFSSNEFLNKISIIANNTVPIDTIVSSIPSTANIITFWFDGSSSETNLDLAPINPLNSSKNSLRNLILDNTNLQTIDLYWTNNIDTIYDYTYPCKYYSFENSSSLTVGTLKDILFTAWLKTGDGGRSIGDALSYSNAYDDPNYNGIIDLRGTASLLPTTQLVPHPIGGTEYTVQEICDILSDWGWLVLHSDFTPTSSTFHYLPFGINLIDSGSYTSSDIQAFKFNDYTDNNSSFTANNFAEQTNVIGGTIPQRFVFWIYDNGQYSGLNFVFTISDKVVDQFAGLATVKTYSATTEKLYLRVYESGTLTTEGDYATVLSYYSNTILVPHNTTDDANNVSINSMLDITEGTMIELIAGDGTNMGLSPLY